MFVINVFNKDFSTLTCLLGAIGATTWTAVASTGAAQIPRGFLPTVFGCCCSCEPSVFRIVAGPAPTSNSVFCFLVFSNEGSTSWGYT